MQIKSKPFTVIVFMVLITVIAAPTEAAPPIKVAGIIALSGEAAIDNSTSIPGVELAVEQINKGGGVLGRSIDFFWIDNHSSAIGSMIAARKAATAGALAIIGPAWSSHALGSAKVAQANKIIMLATAATSPKITRIGDYIFRVCFTDTLQGKVMALFAAEDLKAGTAAVIKDAGSEYSLGLADEFQKHFNRMNGEVICEVSYLKNQKDFGPLLEQIKASDPQVVFVPGHLESGRIVDEAQKMGIQAVYLGGDGWLGDGFMQVGGRSLKHGYYSTHWTKSNENLKRLDFMRLNRHSEQIDGVTALSYDAVYLLIDAIQRANSLDVSRIRNALAQTERFEGITGTIRMDAFGDPDKNVVIMEIRDGQTKFLKTIDSKDMR